MFFCPALKGLESLAELHTYVLAAGSKIPQATSTYVAEAKLLLKCHTASARIGIF